MMLVFQYGSNCLDSEINSPDRLRDEAKFVDIAETVEDIELAFDVWSSKRGSAASDIVRKLGGKVWGVLYEIPDYLIGRETAKAHQRKSFDASKVRARTTSERRSRFAGLNGDDRVRSDLTVKSPKPGLKTNIDYVRHIVYGLREHKVPDSIHCQGESDCREQ